MQQRSITKLRGLDYDLNKLQDNIYNSIGPLLTNSLNWGIIIPDIVLLANTPLPIDHTLGRQPQGWVIIDRTTNSSVWRNSWNQRSITITANANTTVSLYVF